jgi:hypothetical protein
MREQFGTAVGLAIGVLVYDAFRGQLDGSSLHRAGVALLLSFALLAGYRKQRRERE